MGCQYNSTVDFQLSIKSDFISFPDICAKSAKFYAGLRSSGCNLIINVHCSGESASKIGEVVWDRSFRLLLGPPGLNCLSSFASYFQWCRLTDQGSPSVMQQIVSVESSSLLLHSYLI